MANFCPYCGAPLTGDAAFCMDCGKRVPTSLTSADGNKGKKTPKKYRDAKKKRKQSSAAGKAEVSREDHDAGYDGYYEDVPVADAGRKQDGVDIAMIKRVAIIAIGALGVVGLAIVIMLL